MRSTSLLRLLTALAVGLTGLHLSSAPAAPAAPVEKPPPGAVDGVPVGDWDPAGGPAPAGSAEAPADAEIAAVAPTVRYFGDGAYAAVQQAAAAATKCSGLTSIGLTYMALTPVFGEAGAATSPSTAPAPMTLSRFDEWTGDTDGSSNRDYNYGLYAFRNPNTAYKRAFWHPGIGIWQYDVAGAGAPFTGAQAIDVRAVAGDVTANMASAWCGFAGTAAAKRMKAWQPWSASCTKDVYPTGAPNGVADCEDVYLELVATSGPSLVGGIGATGGMLTRSCAIDGGSPVPCYYVNPNLAQGASWWRVLAPLDGGSPTTTPTPVSLPFYVLSVGGTEVRHWIHEDTGYGIDIAAARTLGKDARPRPSQAGSGLTWSSGRHLCDLTALRGACEAPPPPKAFGAVTMAADLEPRVGDLDGDGQDDIVWYGEGSKPDRVWRGRTDGSFATYVFSINGTYTPLMGDVDGDNRAEVIWYGRGSIPDYVAEWTGSTFTAIPFTITGDYVPLVGDIDGDGKDEVIWYGKGSTPDYVSEWTGSTFTAVPFTITGDYVPLVGDIDGDGKDEVIWYGKGSTPDYVSEWTGSTFTAIRFSITGDYVPLVGDIDGDGKDEVIWYGKGSTPDYVSEWTGSTFTAIPFSINGAFTPAVVELDGDGRDDIVWHGPGSLPDYVSEWTGSTFTAAPVQLWGAYRPIVGSFDTGTEDVIWWSTASYSPYWRG